MKKVLIVLGLFTLLGCSDSEIINTNDCNCYFNSYVNNELVESEYYGNDCSYDNKIISRYYSYITKIECE